MPDHPGKAPGPWQTVEQATGLQSAECRTWGLASRVQDSQRVRWFAAAVVVALLASGSAAQVIRPSNPVTQIPPPLSGGIATALDGDFDRQLDAGRSVVALLPSRGRDLGVMAATRVDARGDRLVAWVRRPDQLYKGRHVTRIARFSDPPRPEDLADLELDDPDLEDIRQCRPGDCGMKLTQAEIVALRQTTATSGPAWKSAVQEMFRDLVLARTRAYLADGLSGLPPYYDKKTPVWLDAELTAVIDHYGGQNGQTDGDPLGDSLGLAGEESHELSDYVRRYPHVQAPHIESFLYWAKEALGARPIVTVTHVMIVHPRQSGTGGHTNASGLEALVLTKQIFATHYVTGALAVTAIVGGDGMPRQLIYINRSRADVFGGVWGGLVRRMVERRIKAEAPEVLLGLRRRLESGAPPGEP